MKKRGVRELLFVLSAIAVYFWANSRPEIPTTNSRESPMVVTATEAATAAAAQSSLPIPSGYREADVKDTIYSIRGAKLGENGEPLASASERGELQSEAVNSSGIRYVQHELSTEHLTVGLDQHNKIGYLMGDSLERGDIPVLAVGNLPTQVEDVLGQPVELGPSKIDPGTYIWYYGFRTFTLQVRFLEGKVHNFLLESNDMVMAGS